MWYDEKLWKRMPPENPDAEATFELKSEDAYAMIIAEKFSMPLESLADVALENAREAAPDAKVVLREYRIVNGDSVLCQQIDGTIRGIKFICYTYLFSNEKGIVQLYTYTGSSIFGEKKKEMEDFLNGGVMIK